MAAVPTCGPATGPEPGNVVVVVGEAAGSWATGFCADPGIPVLGSMTCGVTNLPGQLDLYARARRDLHPRPACRCLQRRRRPDEPGVTEPDRERHGHRRRDRHLHLPPLRPDPQCVPDDGDGIAEPVGVDGNGDGTADSGTASVATFTPAAGGGLVTLAAPDPSYTITGVRALPIPAAPRASVRRLAPDRAHRLLGHAALGPDHRRRRRDRTPGTNPNSYLKLQAGSWVDVSYQATFAGDTVTLHLADGDPFDTDPTPGVIGDPGGPAVVDETPPTVSRPAPTDGATYTLGAVPTVGCTATDEPGGSESGARPAPCRSPAATPTASGASPRPPAPPTSPATRPRSPAPTGWSTPWTPCGCRSRRC